jgi:hypothetical protein
MKDAKSPYKAFKKAHPKSLTAAALRKAAMDAAGRKSRKASKSRSRKMSKGRK